MVRIFGIWIVALVAIMALGGCVESQRPVPTGKGHVRGVNGIVTAPSVLFRIEERNLGSLDYKISSDGARWDSLSYNFNFDVFVPGELDPVRVITHPLDLAQDTDYVFLLSGSIATPEVLEWTQPERIFDGSETVFEIGFGHAAQTLLQYDVYFDTTGTVPMAGAQRATLGFRDFSPAIELPEGEYEVILTTPGNPMDIVYQSEPTTLNGANGLIITIFDPDPSLTAPVNVRLINRAGTAAELLDAAAVPSLRIMHTAFGTENVDVYLDGDFSAPIASDLAFGQITPDLTLGQAAPTLTFTMVGNPGAPIYEQEVLVLAGARNTAFLAGEPMDLRVSPHSEDRRSRETVARYRVTHMAFNIQLVDLYVKPAGTDINDELPTIIGLPYLFNSGYNGLAADSYEMTLTMQGTKDIVAGPLPLDLALGDVVEIAIVDTVDPAMLDLIIYDQ